MEPEAQRGYGLAKVASRQTADPGLEPQLAGSRVHAVALFSLLEALRLWTACVMSFCASWSFLRGWRVPSGLLYVDPNPHTPMSPWMVGAKSGLTGLWVTQCHSGHTNRRWPRMWLGQSQPPES